MNYLLLLLVCLVSLINVSAQKDSISFDQSVFDFLLDDISRQELQNKLLKISKEEKSSLKRVLLYKLIQIKDAQIPMHESTDSIQFIINENEFDSEIKFFSYYTLAKHFLDHSPYHNNSILFIDSTKKYTDTNNLKQQIAFDLIRAAIYAYHKLYEESLIIYNRLLTKIEDSCMLARICSNLGGINLEMDKTEKAFECYQKSLKYSEGSCNKKGKVYLSMAMYYIALYELDSAEYYCLLVLNEAKKNGLDALENAVYPILARINGEKGKENIAVNYYYKTIKYYDSIGSPNFAARSKLDLARYYLHFNKPQQAKELANDVIKQYPSFLKTSPNVFYLLSEIYVMEQNYRKAYDNFKKFYFLRDSLFGADRQKQINLIQASFDIELLKKDNHFIQRENEQKEEFIKTEKKYNQIKTFFLVGLIILFVLLSWFMYKNDKKKQEIQTQRIKNKELENKTLLSDLENVKQKIKDKNMLINELEDYIKNEPDDKLISSLVDKLKVEKDWASFYITFEKIFSIDLNKIKANHSQLSKNDIRIMVLSKLNLSNKETASILNVSVAAVEKARFRFRKKFDDKRDESFTEIVNHLLED